MTLIVYKDGILAADTRTSATHAAIKDFSCAHCNNLSKPVRDRQATSKIGKPRKRATGLFEGQKILAYGLAGDLEKCIAVDRLLRYGEDLKIAHEHYTKLHNPRDTQDYSCTALLVCSDNVFVVNIPARGVLKIDKQPRSAFVTIGSGRQGAQWINHLLPKLSAVNIINLVMAKDMSVGGEIDYWHVDSEEDFVIPHKAVKGDPKEMLEKIQLAFLVGSKIIQEKESKEKEK